MTLVFIFWGSYDGFKDTLACAKARAGCPIWVISDGAAPAGVNHMPLSAFPDAYKAVELISPNAGSWAAYSLSRWFLLREFAKQHPEAFPIFCADWDVLIFRDLATAYKPFEQFDYTVSINEGMASAAYGVNRMEPLHSFCELVQQLNVDNDPRAKNLNDMEAWSLNTRTNLWSVGDLFQIRNASVFDHNIHCGADRFMMNNGTKKVLFDIYENKLPYFVLHDGTLIAANTIHCWGTWKTKTAEARKLAGIEL